MHRMAKRRSISRQGLALLACVTLAACRGELASDFAPAPVFEGDTACGSPRLGCATENNIAALAQRPSDLAKPRRAGQRDPVRREAALSAYRGPAAPPRAAREIATGGGGHAGD